MMTPPKNIKAVIFDCDGVIFDSRRANERFYNHLLAHFSLPPLREDQVDRIHMFTSKESIEYIFRGSPHVAEAQAYHLRMDYTPFIEDLVLEPGLSDLLAWLKPRAGLAVATNRSDTIGRVLDCFDLTGFFQIVVSCLDVKQPKPGPDALLKILNFFDLEPAEAVYVGDSEVDARASRAAGVPFIAYKNKQLRADWHVQNHGEIQTLLCG